MIKTIPILPVKNRYKVYLDMESDIELALNGALRDGLDGVVKVSNASGNSYNLTLPSGQLLQKYLPSVVEIADGKCYEFVFSVMRGKVYWYYTSYKLIVGQSVDTSDWNTSTLNWLDQPHIDLSIVNDRFRITRNSEAGAITQLNSARSFDFLQFGVWRCEANFHNTSPYNDCEAVLSIQENGETAISSTPLTILSGNSAVVTLDVEIRNTINNAIFSIKQQRASAFDYFVDGDYVEFSDFSITQIAY